ncbi:unnamed protein product [Owenia fusiformis]|uniref:Molybdate-anion transporter n=1 Tax=Owenia fusiformis TaxID=6347 RepID=A0A8J1TX78_OWEFU|nr:unnamed protein product [Owenia fusiformis]
MAASANYWYIAIQYIAKMMVITYVAFVVLGVLCIGLQYWAIKSRKDPPIGNNPTFLKFQRGYFAAYFLAVVADWLQGPYLYRLYSYYNFMEDQIAVLYVCGFASTVILGTWAPIAADRFGRKKLCFMFTIVYSLACFFKLSRNYGVLIMGRILGGVATSLLFSSFEAWYVHEHIETHDFPKEWIPVTFAKAGVWNGILAIVAGVVANFLAEWCGLGPVAPFMLSIPCLIISGIIVMTQWQENYGTQSVTLVKSCGTGLRTVFSELRIFMIGVIASLFESVMYIVIFIWTPVLIKGGPSLGITFSSFMVCIMIGSAANQILVTEKVQSYNLLLVSVGMALLANIICIPTTNPDDPNRNLSFLALLIYQISVGIYFPSMGFLRIKIIPDAHRTSVMNWFRVPLNIIACFVLMLLHNSSFRHGNYLIFIITSGLLTFALLLSWQFVSMVKTDSDLQNGSTSENDSSVSSA